MCHFLYLFSSHTHTHTHTHTRVVPFLSHHTHTHTHTHTSTYTCPQLLTDRFAQTQDPSSPCSDLSTYCGGTFNGIAAKLDYIQGLGANAIWISPIPTQTPNGYHGYWQMDINKVNSHFGTEADLQNLVQECHSRGIWVMLDV